MMWGCGQGMGRVLELTADHYREQLNVLDEGR